MTPEDRNKLNEEIVKSLPLGQLDDGIYWMWRDHYGVYGIWKRETFDVAVAEHQDLPTAIALARQHLAKEAAEAAKSEREKRLEDKLRMIAEHGKDFEDGACNYCATIARKALES